MRSCSKIAMESELKVHGWTEKCNVQKPCKLSLLSFAIAMILKRMYKRYGECYHFGLHCKLYPMNTTEMPNTIRWAESIRMVLFSCPHTISVERWNIHAHCTRHKYTHTHTQTVIYEMCTNYKIIDTHYEGYRIFIHVIFRVFFRFYEN